MFGLKVTFQVFDQLVIPERSAEGEVATVCLSEGWGMLWQRVESSAKKIKRISQRIREIIDEDQQ